MTRIRLGPVIVVMALSAASMLPATAAERAAAIDESAREIPIAYRVDVVVVGGSSAGVAAAVEAARYGADVFLAAPRPYLGEDLCGTARLWLEEDQVPTTPLAKKLFPEKWLLPARKDPTSTGPSHVPVYFAKPLHVKRTLDEALLSAGVKFLFGCYATDVLRDEEGSLSGIVMANRAGRQAVVAKLVIDATDRAWVARMAGARFRPFPAGLQTVKRVVIGGQPRTGPRIAARLMPFRVPSQIPGEDEANLRAYKFLRTAVRQVFPVIEYTLQVPMQDGSYTSWAEAEQAARGMTYHPGGRESDHAQQFTSEVLFQVPPDPMRGKISLRGAWPRAEKVDLDAFRPAGVERLYVLGGCADVPRPVAEMLLRPAALVGVGMRIGRAAAAEAAALRSPKGVRLAGKPAETAAPGDVAEILRGVRPTQQGLPTIRQDERAIPVLGRYDVVVVGGGTSGAPAGIAAARHSARTLVLEYQYGLGGVGTEGAITAYWYGNQVGFTKEVGGGPSWTIQSKMEWWRRTLRKAGADIWLGVLGCGAVVDAGHVRGVIVATPQGRGVVLAEVVVDATGNADVAIAAGASYVYVDQSHCAMQGTGLPPRRLGGQYANTDFTITDETDMLDAWHVLIYAKSKYGDVFDIGQFIDTRERRRIVGDFTLTLLDQVIGRTYPDTIVRSYSNYDSHGYSVEPYFFLLPPPEATPCATPYRCLLPRGLDGILVTGLGTSAERGAMAFIRMQADLQNQGYAAGVAAAMAARLHGRTRRINIRKLQEHLVEISNLPESVLTDEDSYPAPPERIAAAVRNAAGGYQDAALILAHSKQALPQLRAAYTNATGQAKLIYGHVLAVLKDASGLPTLLAEIERFSWDKGYSSGSNTMSPVDRLMIAAGRPGDHRATGVILAKLRQLDADSAFSHHRAVGVALESIGDPGAAGPLAELLAKPGMTGYSVCSLEEARRLDNEATKVQKDDYSFHVRDRSYREIILARALFRCGDQNGLGETILKQYVHDLRGVYARHARAVLAEQPDRAKENSG